MEFGRHLHTYNVWLLNSELICGQVFNIHEKYHFKYDGETFDGYKM